MTDSKKPGVAFFATVALAVLVLYVLGIGPVCWVSSRTNTGVSIVPVVYRPLTWVRSEYDCIAIL